MLLSAMVALILLVITKRTSSLVNTLCKYLCTLSRPSLRVHTAVPPHSSTSTQPEAAAISWVRVLLPPSAHELLTVLYQALALW